jgi:hypothetical protein
MNASGMSLKQLELMADLEAMERQITAPDSLAPPDMLAKALTCLAHDWAQLGLEEEAHRLLLKADKVFPGYHGAPMRHDMAQDPDFDLLGRSLALELAVAALSTARDN